MLHADPPLPTFWFPATAGRPPPADQPRRAPKRLYPAELRFLLSYSLRVCILTLGCESNGLIQTEFEDRFRRNTHFLAFGKHLGSSTPGGSHCGSDGCALSVSDYRANNCADDGSAANHLRRALVRAYSTAAFFFQVRSAD